MRARRSSATWKGLDMTALPLAAEPMGFFTDTTICIGCKACEVACKNWNQLPAETGGIRELSGDSYDNTRKLDGLHWRHVKFIEQFDGPYNGRWLMMSDVCKHCVQAGCLEVCPTGAIIRTEFDTVVIQSDVCNGCRDCIAACPFGVMRGTPGRRRRRTGRRPVTDTFFTAAPRWEWFVILYFFFGGTAGGSYAIAALIDVV